MNYPTGGYTKFEWESNRSNDLSLDKQIVTSDNLHEDVFVSIKLNTNNTIKNTYTFKGDPNTNTSFQLTFPHNYNSTTGYVEQVVKNSSGAVIGGSGTIPTSSTQPITNLEKMSLGPSKFSRS